MLSDRNFEPSRICPQFKGNLMKHEIKFQKFIRNEKFCSVSYQIMPLIWESDPRFSECLLKTEAAFLGDWIRIQFPKIGSPKKQNKLSQILILRSAAKFAASGYL